MSFMLLTGPRPSPSPTGKSGGSSYGWRRALVQIAGAAGCSLALIAVTAAQRANAEAPVKIVALGDSLTAGYGLPAKDGFVLRLQAALAAKRIAAEIENAGVSGDTAADGLARLDWSVPQGTDAVIVELGANDMLRGIKPQVTRDALDAILRRLTERHIVVLLCGMRAAPNLGAEYGQAFARIYRELAVKYGVLLYPFFLDGVAADLSLTQHDGMHPNAAGVGVIVERILPKVEELIAGVRTEGPS
jgi:acyl-CoA thioesterase I